MIRNSKNHMMDFSNISPFVNEHPLKATNHKKAGPSWQLFETVNFAFMKIFDF